SSLDFVASGAGNRLEGLMIASAGLVAAGNSSETIESDGETGGPRDGGSSEGDEAGFVVVGGPNSDTVGVFRGDHLVAVNGIPLPSMQLREWIEASAATIPNASQPASSTSSDGRALLTVVAYLKQTTCPVDEFPTTRSSVPSPNHVSSLQCTVGPHDLTCNPPAASASTSPSTATETGAGMGRNLKGFPLKGFLKIELVRLEDAEVAFRPGASWDSEPRQRSFSLIAPRRRRRERKRAVAEAKALLENAKREQEDEAKRAEASAKAEETERAREQAEADRVEEERRQEEARARREEEAAKKAAENSKKDVARLRKEGKQFTFTAQYKEVAPMGLTFDLANPFAVVSEVTPGGLSYIAGVKVGDHLVRVNERETGEMKPAATLKVLQRAVWPRVLTFSVPESLVVEGGDEPLLLGLLVTDPEIVRGEYMMQAPKDWGRYRTVDTEKEEDVEGVQDDSWPCEPHLMALVDPAPACQRDLRLLSGAGENVRGGGPVIALVKRGVCTFVEKAKNVQLAIFNNVMTADKSSTTKAPAATTARSRIAATVDGGISITTAADSHLAAGEGNDAHQADVEGGVRGGGAMEKVAGGGMVLLNGEDALADMPAGNLLTDDVDIPVAMISRGNGSSLEEILSWGVEVRATISPLGGCTLPSVPPDYPGTQSAKSRKEDDDGGRFLLLSKTAGVAEFDYRLARYGPGIGDGETSPVAIAVADPVDGCEDKAYKFRVAGMFVAVERGGCSFSMKTLAAQRAGAEGVIIVNTAEATLRVMADQGDGDRAHIPTVMVSAAAGKFLSGAAAGSSRSPILGRFRREDVDVGRG
ncbi:unnamed protein product, partial [Scytosiphon promiscuus]